MPFEIHLYIPGIRIDEIPPPVFTWDFIEVFFFLFVHPQWHLGFFKSEYTPTMRGFDSFFGYWSGKEDYWDHSSDAPGQGWGLDFHNNTKVSECAREYLIFLSQMELFG